MGLRVIKGVRYGWHQFSERIGASRRYVCHNQRFKSLSEKRSDPLRASGNSRDFSMPSKGSDPVSDRL
jgi:hypothetical protein